MKNRDFYISNGLAIGVFACLFLALVGIDRTKEEKINFADRPVWDLSNNDEEYWKQWSDRRNAIVNKLLEIRNGKLSLFDETPPIIPATSKDYLAAFYDTDRKSLLYIERLDMNEFQKVNQHFLDQFPLVSLQDRLHYEDNSSKLAQHSQRHHYDLVDTTTQMHDEWNAYYYRHDHSDLQAYERPLKHQIELTRGYRHLALEVLHREGVRAFANQVDGFGYERMPDIDHYFLRKENPVCVELPEDISMQMQGRGDSDDSPERKELDFKKMVDGLRGDASKYMHLAFYHQFTKDTSYVPSFRQARGFDGHRVTDSVNWEFDVDHAPKDPLWQVERMELVGLLKHDEPVVYISTKLPNMKQLVNGKTRPLDKFEATALEKIYQGEFIITEPQHDKLRMMGAVRAGKTCLDCHAVKAGEVLGAFSYVIGPPARPKSKAKADDVTLID